MHASAIVVSLLGPAATALSMVNPATAAADWNLPCTDVVVVVVSYRNAACWDPLRSTDFVYSCSQNTR